MSKNQALPKKPPHSGRDGVSGPRETVAPSLEEKLQRLIAADMLSWNGRKLAPSVRRVPLRGSRTVSELLLEDRE